MIYAWFIAIVSSMLITICLLDCDAFPCNTPIDCELNGDCVNNIRQCHEGWKVSLDPYMMLYSLSCSSLNLTTAPFPESGVWPLSTSHEKETCYSWGFTAIKSQTNIDNLY
eukprot:1120806_1